MDQDFFNTFTNLKSLNIVGCTSVSNKALKKCFQNNQGIKSFVSDNPYLNYSKLKLLPHLEQLGLHYVRKRINLSILSKLKSPLRSLSLHCKNEYVNVNGWIKEIAIKNELEEMELENVIVDGNTFEIIKSLRKLQRLIITTHGCKFTWSNELPYKLKTLKLVGFHISQRQIESLQQRRHLENIQIDECNIITHGLNAKSAMQKYRLDRKGKVNLIFTTSGDKSPKVN